MAVLEVVIGLGKDAFMELDRKTAIAAYCYCRQAERSLDRALVNPAQWTGLLHYYSLVRREALGALTALLRKSARPCPPLSREHFNDRFPLWLFFSGLKGLVNRRKKRWRFKDEEMCFLGVTLGTFLSALNNSLQPTSDFLVDLRIDLVTCEYIIEKRMYGVPELRTARDIEHYCHPPHIKAITFEQLEHSR